MAWIMTPDGILMPSLVPDEFVKDGLRLAVRSRRKEDLERFRAQYLEPFDAPMSPIYTIEGSDYDFRFDTTHEAFADASWRLMMGIDYVKFKPETENAEKGRSDRELHETYNRIWHVVAPLGRPYGKRYRPSFGEWVWLTERRLQKTCYRLRGRIRRWK